VHAAAARRSTPRWRWWPEWSGYAAAAWSLAYGALGLYWAGGGVGFPFGLEHDPGARSSVLVGARQPVGAPAIAVLGLMGAAAAFAMTRTWGGGKRRAALLGFAWTVAVGLSLVVPDFRVLVVVAYAPILLVSAAFGRLPEVRAVDAVPWPVLNQVVCIVGGLVWAATALAYQRRTGGACGHCGRTDAGAAWTTPRAAARWGRGAVYVAAVVPLVYALTRWAWALGFPLGITEKFFRQGQAIGLWWRGAALATLAAGGALLTFGLAQRWGEVFPRWLPFAAGKAVPPALAIAPAAFVSVIVTAAGLMFVRVAFAGTFALGNNRVSLDENLGALAPELLWPAWGIALGAATLAYYYRTRGRCRYCGRL